MPVPSARHHLVGGGIASLAAAVFLIRDAGVPGDTITIYEELDRPGGSLDGRTVGEDSYFTRGGRMFEPNFICTRDLLETIPMPGHEERNLWQDIEYFNLAVPGTSKCRLLRDGQKADMSLGLSAQDVFELNRLMLTSEAHLQGHTIGQHFSRGFFDSNFWIMWSTMFSFQPWHSAMEMRRYMRRFIHLLPGMAEIRGILRTRYNQYDSIVAPIVRWLRARGVRIETGRRVTDLRIDPVAGGREAKELMLDGAPPVTVGTEDRVYLTLGSMTDASTQGSNDTAPPVPGAAGGAWALWRRLAARHRDLGNPDVFSRDPAQTTWSSFTATMTSPAFFEYMEGLTGNWAGTGGLVTLAESGWMLSVVMFHQPHFVKQDPGHLVMWGFGLRGDRDGDHVRKPMWECTGDEVLAELIGQLRLTGTPKTALAEARVVTSRMPYITSQFMPRDRGDRPRVRPEGAKNFALMGQFVELPLDTVFTVEYSVRSARVAVHEMTGKAAPPPPVVREDRDPAVLLRAARALYGG
ncbi:oleate hydratase [Aestuariicoccus sp. MJ-SS9]|uniref:oleate hydratase n=1 Tax=Aestuariicoccus sp. MJ-SS9 TaxID=3079855 RepID=UPI0029077AA3|nr:oleate hydratase [Aestuariicoccus sp. MJ-SS9]MDU8912040.1 oleate hydratase [Aestuariicoccus sp. MJ-SS9]